MNSPYCTFCNLFSAVQGMMQELKVNHARKDHPSETKCEEDPTYKEENNSKSEHSSVSKTSTVNKVYAKPSNDDLIIYDSSIPVERENFSEINQDTFGKPNLINNVDEILETKSNENETKSNEKETKSNEKSIESFVEDQSEVTENMIVHKSQDILYSMKPSVQNEKSYIPALDDIQSGFHKGFGKVETKPEGNVLKMITKDYYIGNLNNIETNTDQIPNSVAVSFQSEIKESKIFADQPIDINFEDILGQFSKEEKELEAVEEEEEEMNLELELNEMEITLICTLCTFKCSEKRELYGHIKDNHNIQVSKLDENGYWNCNICFDKYISNTQLQDHKKVIHGKSQTLKFLTDDKSFWDCNICNKKYSSQMQLRNHRGEIHGKSKIKLKDGEKDHEGFWKCNFCTETLPFRKQLIKHVTECHKDESPDLYTCAVCGRGFRKEETYRHHVKIHEGKTFECQECSKVYNTKLSLYIHVKNMHNSVELFTCETCGQTTKSKTALKRHINGVHKKIKRFKCTHCSSCFGSKSVFQTHCKLKHKVANKEATENMLKVLPVSDTAE